MDGLREYASVITAVVSVIAALAPASARWKRKFSVDAGS